MNAEYRHREHFRAIAPRYRDLRQTDERPIAYIAHELRRLPAIEATDIGCGTGRYTRLLVQHLHKKPLRVTCIDYSAAMLSQLHQHFAESGLQVPIMIKASAMSVPLKTDSLNCVFTFNAIHHFGLLEFLRETARILEPGGALYIYTRSRTQNSRTIWGRHFPWFSARETRLYELPELEMAIDRNPNLRLEKVKTFRFRRQSKLAHLIHRALSHHYSTFDLYSPAEFRTALRRFVRNLTEHFDEPNEITWFDENILLILRNNG
jgi:ubiquinone/menaquinone biosynthesis C-methylase UbiE